MILYYKDFVERILNTFMYVYVRVPIIHTYITYTHIYTYTYSHITYPCSDFTLDKKDLLTLKKVSWTLGDLTRCVTGEFLCRTSFNLYVTSVGTPVVVLLDLNGTPS